MSWSATAPRVNAMHAWLKAQLDRVPGRSQLAAAIRYSLSRWEQLSRFLTDGHIDLDNNPVERAIRPVALGRKRPSSRR
jgi:transposase